MSTRNDSKVADYVVGKLRTCSCNTANQMREHYDYSTGRIQKGLKLAEDQGRITSRRDGRQKVYSLVA